MFKKNFNYIINNKNKTFTLKYVNICDKIVLRYYLKKKEKTFKKDKFKILWGMFSKFNSLFGKFPLLSIINIQIKNKKKKARSLNYIYLQADIVNNMFSIFDLLFVKNSFFNMFYLYSKKYKLNYGQEITNISFFKNITVSNNLLICNFNFNFIFSNLNTRKSSKKIFRSKKKFNFRFVFTGKNIKYFLNIISSLLVNNAKFLLFYYKSLRNKKIKV